MLLIGVVGALALRGVFIALGAQMLTHFDGRSCSSASSCSHRCEAAAGHCVQGHDHHEIDISSMRSVRLLRRLMPVKTTTTAPA